MNHQMGACIVLAVLGGIGTAVHAQGHRPSTPGTQGLSRAPTVGNPLGFEQLGSFERLNAEARRQHTEARRAAAEARREEAQRKRQEAQARNKSDEARAKHPPNQQAASEAFLADQNAENQTLRDERKQTKEKNRGDHGTK